MTTTLEPATTYRMFQEFLDELGGISPARVCMIPPPGLATEQDVINADDHQDRLCELVEGVLVEKPMGLKESILAAALIQYLGIYVRARKLGVIAGEAGMVRLMPGLVRIPDVSFISYSRLTDGKVPGESIPPIAPDLVVEVLSASNTVREMARKRREYFQAGSLLVWEVDPEKRQVDVYEEAEHCKTLTTKDSLDGGKVLPGFSLSLNELFAVLDR